MTDEDEAMAVVDALRGIHDTHLRCPEWFYGGTMPCNGRLRGAVGEALFCSRCGARFRRMCRVEHFNRVGWCEYQIGKGWVDK